MRPQSAKTPSKVKAKPETIEEMKKWREDLENKIMKAICEDDVKIDDFDDELMEVECESAESKILMGPEIRSEADVKPLTSARAELKGSTLEKKKLFGV